MTKPQWIKIIALSGALSVALGAFAAHGLQDALSATYLQTFRTAVLYQFLHTIALLALVSLPDSVLNPRHQAWAAKSFLLGIVLFSGSLYALVFTGISALGMITPLGGLAFILGWMLLFTGAQTTDKKLD